MSKVVVSDIHYHLVDRTLRISTIGRRAFKTKAIDSKPIFIGNNSEVVSEFNLKQNYPNPFNGSTKIEFSLQKKGNVNIYIYNSAGKKIYDKLLSNLNEGAQFFLGREK